MRGKQNIRNWENCYFWTNAGCCWQHHEEWHSDTAASERRLVAVAHRDL